MKMSAGVRNRPSAHEISFDCFGKQIVVIEFKHIFQYIRLMS